MDALFHMAPGCQKKTTEVKPAGGGNGQSILIGGLITPRVVPTRPVGADAQVIERVPQTEGELQNQLKGR
jgi:hypothetical protein